MTSPELASDNQNPLDARMSSIALQCITYLMAEIESEPDFSSIENIHQTLINRIERHQIAPIVYDYVDVAGLFQQDSLDRVLKKLYQRQLKHSSIRFRLFRRIIESANERFTPLVALKGMAIAPVLYPAIVHRQCTDMDLLYRRQDEKEIRELIREIGFDLPGTQSTHWMGLNHHLPNATMDVDGMTFSLELHHDAINRDLPWKITHEQASFMDVRYQDYHYPVLSHHDQLFHLCVHCCGTGGMTKLINMVDIVLYVEKYAQEIDWIELENKFPVIINTFRLIHPIIPFELEPDLERKFELDDIEVKGAGKTMQGVSCLLKRDLPLSERLHALLAPPPWWMHLRYCVKPGQSLVYQYLLIHPLELGRLLVLRMLSLLRYKLKVI